MIPASLDGGSSTDNNSVLQPKSIPRSAAGSTFNSFFLAFIIFGKDAYLGSFNLRSVGTIEGIVSSSV